MFGAGIDEVKEAGAAVKFGEENGSVRLGLRALDPLQAGPDGAALAASLAKDSAAITADPHGCTRSSSPGPVPRPAAVAARSSYSLGISPRLALDLSSSIASSVSTSGR